MGSGDLIRRSRQRHFVAQTIPVTTSMNVQTMRIVSYPVKFIVLIVISEVFHAKVIPALE
jgi:hypothetical protein